MGGGRLKLLEDHFLLSIMAKLVGTEEVTIIESCEVVDVNKSCLGKNKGRKFRTDKPTDIIVTM